MNIVTEDILKESDLYKVLGVSNDIDLSEINKIYKTLAKKYHPDMISTSDPSEKEKANQIFAKITSAYNILKDVEKRKNYDYEIRLKQEYEKTINMTTFTFSKPGGSGISININTQSQNKTQAPQKGTPASEETKNEQAEKMYNLALEKYQAGNIDAAILDLQTAIVLSKAAKYHSCLGLFMNEKGWGAYAQSHFKTALNIDPKDRLALKYINIPEENQDKKDDKKKPEVKQNNTKNLNVKKEESKGLLSKIKDFFSRLFSKK
jgi:curved DNA-binding protein CbpA